MRYTKPNRRLKEDLINILLLIWSAMVVVGTALAMG